jgi:hypothetical protein
MSSNLSRFATVHCYPHQALECDHYTVFRLFGNTLQERELGLFYERLVLNSADNTRVLDLKKMGRCNSATVAKHFRGVSDNIATDVVDNRAT